MLRRSKQLASLILVAGLGLGIVGCGNKKVDETKKDNLTTMSKNDVEETENKENNNETLKEEITETTDSMIESNSSTNTASNNSDLSNSSNSNSKPSTTKPSNSSNSNSKPSTTKPSNSSSSSNNPSTTTKPSNSSSSSSKPSTTTKPSNSSSSSSKPSTTTKPSNSSSSSSKPSTNKKPSTNSSSSNNPSNTTKPNTNNNSSNKPSTKRTWQYMSSLSEQTFNALNKYRKDNGVAPLKCSSSEQSRANSVAEECAKNSYIRHDLMQIALGNEIGTPSSFINQWSNSPSHRNSMLESEFVEGAVSVYKDSKGYYYVVASFADGW